MRREKNVKQIAIVDPSIIEAVERERRHRKIGTVSRAAANIIIERITQLEVERRIERERAPAAAA